MTIHYKGRNCPQINRSQVKIARNLLFIALLLLLVGLGLSSLFENVHTVTPGLVYRSAQLSRKAFSRLIEKHDIKTILNLRGASVGTDWYDEETEMAKRMGVAHFDANLSAKQKVSPERLKQIIALIENAPKPILIHCNGGADRTGLVCAAWKLAAEHEPPDSAQRQLSIIFGHFPHFLWRESIAMDASFGDFAAATQ